MSSTHLCINTLCTHHKREAAGMSDKDSQRNSFLGLFSQMTTNQVVCSRNLFSTILEVKSLKSKCGQGWYLLEDLREKLCQASVLTAGGHLQVL